VKDFLENYYEQRERIGEDVKLFAFAKKEATVAKRKK